MVRAPIARAPLLKDGTLLGLRHALGCGVAARPLLRVPFRTATLLGTAAGGLAPASATPILARLRRPRQLLSAGVGIGRRAVLVRLRLLLGFGLWLCPRLLLRARLRAAVLFRLLVGF